MQKSIVYDTVIPWIPSCIHTLRGVPTMRGHSSNQAASRVLALGRPRGACAARGPGGSAKPPSRKDEGGAAVRGKGRRRIWRARGLRVTVARRPGGRAAPDPVLIPRISRYWESRGEPGAAPGPHSARGPDERFIGGRGDSSARTAAGTVTGVGRRGGPAWQRLTGAARAFIPARAEARLRLFGRFTPAPTRLFIKTDAAPEFLPKSAGV